MDNTFTQTNPMKSLLWVVIVIAGFISFLFVLFHIDTYMKYKAINDCGSISKFEQALPNNIKVTYPVQDIYQDCLKEKGLSINKSK